MLYQAKDFACSEAAKATTKCCVLNLWDDSALQDVVGGDLPAWRHGVLAVHDVIHR